MDRGFFMFFWRFRGFFFFDSFSAFVYLFFFYYIGFSLVRFCVFFVWGIGLDFVVRFSFVLDSGIEN